MSAPQTCPLCGSPMRPLLVHECGHPESIALVTFGGAVLAVVLFLIWIIA